MKKGKTKAKLNNAVLLRKIKKVVASRIRPYVQMDGGDIEIVELTTKRVLKVRFHGACAGCPYRANTMEFGIKNILLELFPKENLKIILIQ